MEFQVTPNDMLLLYNELGIIYPGFVSPVPALAAPAPTANLLPALAAPLPPLPPPPAPAAPLLPAPAPAPAATTTTANLLVAPPTASATTTTVVGAAPSTFTPALRPLPTTYENGAQRVKFVEMARRGWFRNGDWFLLRREVGGTMHGGYGRAAVDAAGRVFVSVGQITEEVEGPTDIISLMARSNEALAGRKGEPAWQLLEFVREGQHYASLHDVREHYWKWKQRQM
ncbi:hypothetical protein MMC17_002932 [Xylographa soralifera]|nr:hypothetical protein [Xylographa soralifera]